MSEPAEYEQEAIVATKHSLTCEILGCEQSTSNEHAVGEAEYADGSSYEPFRFALRAGWRRVTVGGAGDGTFTAFTRWVCPDCCAKKVAALFCVL